MNDRLIPLYREIALTGLALRGLSILRHTEGIAELVSRHRARTVLDYGCGAAEAYGAPHRLHRALGLDRSAVTLFDPAFEEHATLPSGQFDGVLCSDVLEHVPQDDLDEFVARLFVHARLFVWASVCCRQAKKVFPDGTNLHVTIQPIEWWQELFDRHAGAVPWVLKESP